MSIRIAENTVFLESHCSIEEAEALFEAMRGLEKPIFDLTGATYLHTAIVQLVMASAGPVRGAGSDPIFAGCFTNQIVS